MIRRNQCAFIKPDGARCGAEALKGSTLCFYHDPTKADARRQASSRGAATRNRKFKFHPDFFDTVFPYVAVHGSTDTILFHLLDALLKVRDGQMDTRTANSIAYLSTVISQASAPSRLVHRSPQGQLPLTDPAVFNPYRATSRSVTYQEVERIIAACKNPVETPQPGTSTPQGGDGVSSGAPVASSTPTTDSDNPGDKK